MVLVAIVSLVITAGAADSAAQTAGSTLISTDTAPRGCHRMAREKEDSGHPRHFNGDAHRSSSPFFSARARRMSPKSELFYTPERMYTPL
jgi:hypothetical protein